jgi:hypothetical protein
MAGSGRTLNTTYRVAGIAEHYDFDARNADNGSPFTSLPHREQADTLRRVKMGYSYYRYTM